jgi:hypothetical protein
MNLCALIYYRPSFCSDENLISTTFLLLRLETTRAGRRMDRTRAPPFLSALVATRATAATLVRIWWDSPPDLLARNGLALHSKIALIVKHDFASRLRSIVL